MIIALAGHVDHGKTSVVRALTGVETDRLQQEVARGLTIDLGFAYWQAGEQRLGFVDVPGHHRFVHNMLAGISPHQCAMLVIAADDGVMPQTREHLAIMQLLGLARGLVVLNKVDRVDARQLQTVRAEIATTLAHSFLADAPILEVAATTGAGIDALRSALTGMAQTARHAQQDTAASASGQQVRMPIDRAFSYKGVGTIVTGTLHAGSLALEQELTLFPTGIRTRVRSLRANDQKVASAQPGDRVAVNLAGIEPSQAERGVWLQSGVDSGSCQQVVALEVLPDFPREVKHWGRVHVYHGSSHRLAHLALLEGATAAPGSRMLAELLCEAPLLSAWGDRLIVRDHGLDQTLGGGLVIDNQASNRRRREPARLQRLREQQQHTGPAVALDAALAQGWVPLPTFQSLWQITDKALADLCSQHDLLRFGTLVGTRTHFEACVAATQRAFVDAAAQSDGLLAQAFCQTGEGLETLGQSQRASAESAISDALVKALVSAGTITLRNGRCYPANSRPALSTAEQDLLARIEPHLAAAQPPSLGDIGKALSLPADRLRKALQPLAGKGAVVLFGANRLLLPEQFEALATLAKQLEAEHGPFTVKAFRDASGLGRNLVIDVLEHMDAGGYTRRVENNRSVVGDLSRILKRQ